MYMYIHAHDTGILALRYDMTWPTTHISYYSQVWEQVGVNNYLPHTAELARGIYVRVGMHTAHAELSRTPVFYHGVGEEGDLTCKPGLYYSWSSWRWQNWNTLNYIHWQQPFHNRQLHCRCILYITKSPDFLEVLCLTTWLSQAVVTVARRRKSLQNP